VKPMYTIQRCRKDDTLHGPVHYWNGLNETLCGARTGYNWWILTNNFDGVATCKKCIEINRRNRCGN